MKIESVANQTASFQVNRVQSAGKTEIISKEAMDGNQTGTLATAGNMEEKHVATPAGTEEKNNNDNGNKLTQQKNFQMNLNPKEFKETFHVQHKVIQHIDLIFGIIK